ncbi:hypothetical protein SNE40_021428 [Patella caerulea]|uniref:Uncharacterized protein n=1 Tax=Patella caerulea TaxID=87958 RepID=A0AAN8IZ30_PATCE
MGIQERIYFLFGSWNMSAENNIISACRQTNVTCSSRVALRKTTVPLQKHQKFFTCETQDITCPVPIANESKSDADEEIIEPQSKRRKFEE